MEGGYGDEAAGPSSSTRGRSGRFSAGYRLGVADKLKSYRGKRDFKATSEPSGGSGADGDAAVTARFVVQEHHARRLHWDLRLERDGVLKSWAIPNGIPEDPKENRKAVHTEDHPLEYIDFQGEIPKGEYGAGTMKVWDAGTYECHKFREDEVMVTFHGERLRGRYVLFRAGKDPKDWMIHRMDPPADPQREPMPERIVPMLARLGGLPRDQARFAFEVKWDGVRAILYSQPGRTRIQGRRLTDITEGYPELRPLGRQLGSRTAILDGEIVAFDSEGKPSFERLQRRMHLTGESRIKRRAAEIPASYMIFDLLYLDGHSLMDLPYAERRERLDELGLEGPAWRTPAYQRDDGRALLAATAEQGLEGIVAKRLDSRYEPGSRSGAWIKIKNKRRQVLVIGGWMPGEGKRESRVGALLVGYHDADGVLHYAGRVGSGFKERDLNRLEQLLGPLRRKTSPFKGGPKLPRGAVFVKPELVCEVEFTEWTAEMVLRHPAYKGLRDVDAKDVVLGEGEARVDADDGPAALAGETPAAADVSLGPLRELPGGGVEVTIEKRKLRLSNLDKVMYPEVGFTKGQLIDYYTRVSPVLLPHLHGRPLTMKRYPDGVEGKFFYEKQCPSHRPDWVQTASIWSRHNGRNIDFCLVNDLPTLVWAANLADLELHTSLSLAAAVDRPTTMVFDLDPGPPADIVDCCQVGVWVRDLFGGLGLDCFPKTSGSKGIQIYLPLNVETTYADTKPFARAVAELLEKQHSELVVSRMTKSLRAGKVLVDWSQNDEHKTTVCVYSLRARERPTVSTPVTW
ncbi:MAG: bifunctional non-ous end joining protein LigD, partial [Thermoleophilaceae bacterium]|nr:bifunctional non-ous end joining protein LigD [Thermoleophilaceae bacterium]